MEPSFVDSEEWKRARMELLEEEKAMSKAVAALAAKRRSLPWTALQEDYTLKDSTGEEVKLSELFSDDSMDLIIYHLMYGETYESACSLCCFFVDQFNGAKAHLDPRAKLVVVGNTDHETLAQLKETKGWDIQILSSRGTSFNQELGVSFSADQVAAKNCTYNFNRTWLYGQEAPGLSAFRLRNGTVYRTYSTYAAGLGNLSLVHSLLDITSTGRDEDGKRPMWWVKHKEEYPISDNSMPPAKKLKAAEDNSA